MNSLAEYVGYEFQSATYRTPEYISFERKYRNYIKKHLPDGFSIHQFNNNHFEFSCVIKTDKDKFIYFSIPDVRFFPEEWKDDILIREMEHEKDWTGKSNNRTTLETMKEDILELDRKGYVSGNSRRNSHDYEM